MQTRVHRPDRRSALLPAVLAVLVLVAFVAVMVLGRGDEPRDAHRSVPPVTATAAYPREVRVADVADSAVRRAALAANPPVTVLVELAPGVYANRGSGPLGTRDNYTMVFGDCSAVNRYTRTHRVAGAC